jgi:hypothetical protein
MVFDVYIAMTWILFLALFPMAFFWLRRAYRIFIQRDYSEVALKKGEPPPNANKWARATGAVNLIAGVVAVWIIIGIPLWIATGLKIGPFHHFDAWSAMAGTTIWLKVFADFIVSRQAHANWGRKKEQKGKG